MPTIPRKQARGALLEAAVERLSVLGPVRTHPNDICHDLGLSKALVNYHFGNREGLILEAMAVGYERYVQALEDAAAAAGPTALDRLTAWMDAQVEWTVAHPGLAAALNFPEVLSGERTPETDLVHERIREAGIRNFMNLRTMVADARREAHGGDDAPEFDELVLDRVDDLSVDTVAVGWLTFGMSVWLAGRHLPTHARGPAGGFEAARDRVREIVTSLVTA